MFSFVFFLGFCILQLTVPIFGKSDPSGDVVVHATNQSVVPSVRYIVDAVECLKEAYSIFADPTDNAQLYAELFQELHNESEWNVVVGYTAYSIHSKWYIETSVSAGGKNKDGKKSSKDDEKETLYLLFSTN